MFTGASRASPTACGTMFLFPTISSSAPRDARLPSKSQARAPTSLCASCTMLASRTSRARLDALARRVARSTDCQLFPTAILSRSSRSCNNHMVKTRPRLAMTGRFAPSSSRSAGRYPTFGAGRATICFKTCHAIPCSQPELSIVLDALPWQAFNTQSTICALGWTTRFDSFKK